MTNDEIRMTKAKPEDNPAGRGGGFFPDRYSRQERLAEIGPAGQERLGQAHVALIGCGALGSTLAQLLVRAGVGYLRIVDRDFVEANNLQRQTLFEETDVTEALPKAQAAARRLKAINSQVQIEPLCADVHAGNIERLCEGAELLLDGTDNFQTRYLLNDVAVKTGRPWIYGACIGWEGRGMVIRPGATPCLRCLFDDPPEPGTTPTCETAGVIGSIAVMVAGWQAAEAIKLLVGGGENAEKSKSRKVEIGIEENRKSEIGNRPRNQEQSGLFTLDLLANRFHFVKAGIRPDCPCCGRHEYQWLESAGPADATTLCGRDAVQVQAPGAASAADLESALDLAELARRLQNAAGAKIVRQNPYLLRCEVESRGRALVLSLFTDGRAIIQGTSDFAEARNVYARYVGS